MRNRPCATAVTRSDFTAEQVLYRHSQDHKSAHIYGMDNFDTFIAACISDANIAAYEPSKLKPGRCQLVEATLSRNRASNFSRGV